MNTFQGGIGRHSLDQVGMCGHAPHQKPACSSWPRHVAASWQGLEHLGHMPGPHTPGAVAPRRHESYLKTAEGCGRACVSVCVCVCVGMCAYMRACVRVLITAPPWGFVPAGSLRHSMSSQGPWGEGLLHLLLSRAQRQAGDVGPRRPGCLCVARAFFPTVLRYLGSGIP